MTFKCQIDAHKSGKCGRVADIGLPWEKCTNDDEVLEYINYCFQVIALNSAEIKVLSLFKNEDCIKAESLFIEIVGAHGRIETCYKLLNDKLSKVVSDHVNGFRSKLVIYTSKRF